MATPLLAALVASAIGALIGAGEIVSRYKDAPFEAIRTRPGAIYLGVNAGASLAALVLMTYLNWPAETTGQLSPWMTRALAAGFGAMVFFRTSLLTVRAGDQDVPIGPNSLLTILTAALDQEVDRARATARSNATQQVMASISYEPASEALPSYCLALMQNLSPEGQERLAAQIKALAAAGGDHRTKSLVLGLILMNAVGENVLRQAVAALPHIRIPSSITITPATLALQVGAQGSLQASPLDSNGSVLAGRTIQWHSTAPGVASVNEAGIVQGTTPGSATIVASLDRVVAQVSVVIS